MNPRLSVTSRLYLGFMALLVLALAILGITSTIWFTQQQSANLDQFLETEARGVLSRLEGIVEGVALAEGVQDAEVQTVLRDGLRTLLAQRVNRPIPYKTTLLFADSQGTILARSNEAVDLSIAIPSLAPGEMVVADVRELGPAYRVVTVLFPLGPGKQGMLRLACLLSSLEGPFFSFVTSLLVVLGGCLILVSTLGYGLLRMTLAPVRTMAAAAGTLSEQNLGARIPSPPGKDEIARLAETFNHLLARLETDFAFQERLVGDLTHQLKTPLTILRGRNELGLSTRTEVTEFRELIEDNIADIDSLVNLLNTLLELARYDSRIDRMKTRPVNLADFLTNLGDEMGPLWLSKDLVFRTEGPEVTIDSDPEALRQIFLNLFDNACKFAPVGSTILTRWTLIPGGAGVRISVANAGPPIPEDERELIFKRFFRSASQAHRRSGSGLGLSIVRSLVHLHGAQVRAVNPPQGGAAFEIDWPLARTTKQPAVTPF